MHMPFVEAKKLAFEDRAKFYADPTFNKIPVTELISEDYADKRRKLMNDWEHFILKGHGKRGGKKVVNIRGA